jgi:hypothetical protein
MASYKGLASEVRVNKNATAFVKPEEEKNVCAFMIILLKTNCTTKPEFMRIISILTFHSKNYEN